MTIVYVLVALAASLALLAIAYYNGFVAKRNGVHQAFSTIDVMLKKRADLLPNLVATVQQYMKHEAGTLERITQLRSRVTDARADEDARVQANNELTRLLGGLMLQVENYPDLKANRNFTQLADSLHVMEEQLSAARRTYNATVTVYNNAIQMFPGNLVAARFGFAPRALLEIAPEDRKTPDVKALFNS